MTRGPKTAAKPYGREAVMISLLDAARDLFAERGPASVSVRDIAERAQVNHGLIYRHFGTKETLLKAVLRREALAFATAAGDSTDTLRSVRNLFDANVDRTPFLRILAFSLLSGVPVEDLYSEEGALGLLLGRLREQGTVGPTPPGDLDPRVAVAAVSAFMKGWLLFEPWVLQAVGGTTMDVKAVRRTVERILEQVIAMAVPSPGPSRPRTRGSAR